ncbi:DNA polymerase III subunit gamma/tau [Candidatus Saccharibacteria bacterium]|nr:DNA polymerase III subunit gamma/tau [Candidatus Saccharibacteria bacterium]
MKALYRKYRPKTLSEVVGQEQITTPLQNSLKNHKISHSYLFTGPRGTGKTSVARILAHEINNFPYELEDNYLDIIEIDAASNTGVDNIRDLREKALIAPSKGKYKVYIIDEVHMLSKSAFNALLKTLEEPPEHVVFILATTDLDKVPITITSRSQVFSFRLADQVLMLSHLKKISIQENINIEEEALKLIVQRGGGSFRDSLSLLDQISTISSEKITEQQVSDCLGLPLNSSIQTILEAYKAQNSQELTALLKELLSQGLKPEHISESVLRQIINSPDPIFFPLLEKLPSVSAPFPEAKLLLALLDFPNTNHDSPASNQKTPAPQPTQNKKPIEKSTPEPNQEPTSKEKPKPSPCSNSNFDWSSFLTAVKTVNFAIFNQLEKCQYKASNTTIDLYPTKKITKIILEKPANFEILQQNLPQGFELNIHELDELEKSPELAQISDIMGSVQEVNTDGGIPF